MHIEKNISLKNLNSFGFDVSAEYFITAKSNDDLHQAIEWANSRSLPIFILGGGSNIVLTKNIQGLVINVDTRGIVLCSESEHSVELAVQAGEPWHDFVDYCIAHHYFGIENLSLIPGKLGAAPIQNIGAYGVEFSDFFITLNAINLSTGESVQLDKSDCMFAYRNSIFKQALKNTYLITEVRLRLAKRFVANTRYGNIKQLLEESVDGTPSARELSNVICQLRRSKLPDPRQLGNAGSFFTNPIVPRHQFEQLHDQYPNIVGFSVDEQHCKLAAGWLIEQCGWKGFRDARVGVHAQQALVLINHTEGCGNDIIALADKIRQSVLDTFSVTLAIEPLVF